MHRLHGEILLARGALATEVEACYQRALAIAEEQSAKMLSLRAAMSLTRLWALPDRNQDRNQSRCDEARRQLQEIYDWFSEGFDTVDLIEARELLTADTNNEF